MPTTTKIKSFMFKIIFLSIGFAYQVNAQCPKLIWSDEFDSTALDLKKWNYQLGDGCDQGANLCGWGNNELEYYTQQNVQVSNGTLKIIAKQEKIQNSNYSSGRINTIYKVGIKYGRIEARMKLPIGKGMWPAFWMLSTDEVYGKWPKSGELDIMENAGGDPATVVGTIIYGLPYPNVSYSSAKFTQSQGDFSQDFHIYALEWSENTIKWFIDGYLYSTKTISDVGSLRWPFDQQFYILLNLAVGGNFPSNPNSSTVFPQTFEVDYLRVYDMVGAPSISGKQIVPFMQKSSAYSIANVQVGNTIVWSVPVGANIVSGAGTPSILVDWGSTGGKVAATVTTSCGAYKVEVAVKVSDPAPILIPSIVLENFDSTARITRTFNTGVYTDKVPNPTPNDINKSALCGKYIRNAGSQYDVIFYDVSDVTSAGDFIKGTKKFYMDINCNAPVGTNILLQLEDKNRSTSGNYPTGRNSRYTAVTTKQNEWERLSFDFTDQPDAGTYNVNQMVLLFAPNSNTGSTFYLDNFTIYAPSLTPTFDLEKGYSVILSPNPVSDILNLSVTEAVYMESVEIMDVSGRKVLSQKAIKDSKAHLDTRSLNSGVYFVNIFLNDSNKVVKKFIKE